MLNISSELVSIIEAEASYSRGVKWFFFIRNILYEKI